MPQLTLRDGRVIRYTTAFSFDNSHLSKLRLHRSDTCGEGVWFYVHPNDKHDYDNDVYDQDDKVRLGVMSNNSLNGLPFGAIVPYVLRGDSRPECDIDVLLPDDCEPVMAENLPSA